MTVENRNKPYYPRIGGGAGIDSFFRHPRAVSDVLNYFQTGRLPLPIEDIRYRIPGFVKQNVIEVGGCELIVAGYYRGRIPTTPPIDEALVWFAKAEDLRQDILNPEILHSETAKPSVYVSVSWRFSTLLSCEENLTYFAADLASPSYNTRGEDGLLEVQRGPMPGFER